MQTKQFLWKFLFLLLAELSWSQAALEEGEKLFVWDKPEEARPKLEEALLRDSQNERIYYYLSIVYQQLKNPVKAIEVLQRGLPLAQRMKDVMLYQIALNYQLLGDNNLAEKYYSLALETNGVLADAYLNRANSRMKLLRYKEAIEDYRSYLRLKPEARQRKEIEKLIALLEQDFANQEKLLQSILDSLKNASTDTKTNSAGIDEFRDTSNDEVDIMD